MKSTHTYLQPPSNIFSDSSDNWLLFRKKRFAVAGDGEYAALRGWNLSGLRLHSFIVAWLAFVDCNLNNTSFQDTDFTFQAAFVGCSMVNADFRGSFGGSDLFYRCDLTGAIFDGAQHWASVGLDGKKVASYFVDCQMSENLQRYLERDGNIVLSHKMLPEIRQRLQEIDQAPLVSL